MSLATRSRRGGEEKRKACGGLIIAVPLYKRPDLLIQLAEALGRLAGELRGLGARLVFVNDSPGFGPLEQAIAATLPALAAKVDVELLVNPENLGFVRSANRAMVLALEQGCDIVLLNSDTLPRPGAFAEMVTVAGLDPMIGAVSPRSDNATICDSPYVDHLRRGDPDAAFAAHTRIAAYLPRTTYVPTTVGFCMLIRRLMLEEFGLFDEIYGAGYNEENDFVRRFNQRGYRAVLANRAYVHHLGRASFSLSNISPAERDEANRVVLFDRYPESPKLIQRYFEGPEYRAQRLLGGLVPQADGRLRMLFDCRGLGLYFSGTHEHACALVKAFVAAHGDAYAVHIVCDEEAFLFHRLDAVEGLVHCPEAGALDTPFAAVLRIGQPFRLADLSLLEQAAPVSGVLMLDTISLDCQQLDDADLGVLWQRLCLSIDLLGFNSAFSRDQFHRRFDVPPRVHRFVSRCSTSVADYAPPDAPPPAGEAILIVGNHFPHKHVRETVAMAREKAPEAPLLVLGVDANDMGVESHAAGLLPEALISSLYGRARAVLLPSHYEGFGLPIMHGLARRRPVIARDLPSAREIRAACPDGANLHLAQTTAELVALALHPPPWKDATGDAVSGSNWRAAAASVDGAIRHGIEAFDFATLRVRQTLSGLDKGKPGATGSPDADIPGLPSPGQGYMLGRALAARLTPDARSWGERARLGLGLRRAPRFDIDHEISAAPANVSFVKLRIPEPASDLSAIQARLLRWVARVRNGGVVALRLRRTMADGALVDAQTAARLLLLGSGVQVLDVVERGEWFVAWGVKINDWQQLLDGPEGSQGFVQFLYRQALGRHPDQSGASHYTDELENGADRREMLIVFLSSQERQSLIARQIVPR